MPPKPEELTAVFESERNRREDWCVIQLENRILANGKCQAGDLIPGVTYRFLGQWNVHPQYGRQFKFNSFVQSVPHSRRGIVLYLEKFAPGIGPATAHQLIDLYGETSCVGIIKTDPARVAKDLRWTLAKAEKCSEALQAIEGIQETKIDLLDLFSGRGFYSECVDLAIKKWGVNAPTKIRNDPFCLLFPTRFPGAGFSRVDKLYQELGHDSDKIKRQVHCAVFVVDEDSTGSTWVPLSAIVRGIEGLVTGRIRAEKACRIAVRLGMLVQEDRDGQAWYAVRRIGEAEVYTAERVSKLIGEDAEWLQQTTPVTSAADCERCGPTSTTETTSQESPATSSPLSGTLLAHDLEF